MIRGPLRRVTPYSIAAPGVLVQELAAVRSNGVAFMREEVKLGFESVAAPIFGAGGEVVGGMSVTIRVGASSTSDIVAGLRRHTESLSDILRRAS